PEIQTDQQGDRATVTVKFSSPDGNAEVVRDILFVSHGDALPQAERKMLLDKLDRLHKGGQIPTVEGEQFFELVKEADGWRIFENWAEAVRVHFSAEVKHGLPWEFEPVQATVLAKPGETLQNAYRVKNLSEQPITAKAQHFDQPEQYVDFLISSQEFLILG
ncbi:MAG TPA: cytochrome c oxidase assembly protein, partial [Anaerolineae bacterium]|nr:cytochrome c oxidase assembly protein [Anaerolineae bacterium]